MIAQNDHVLLDIEELLKRSCHSHEFSLGVVRSKFFLGTVFVLTTGIVVGIKVPAAAHHISSTYT